MKERPILMTPENAQKCFEGVKTQTRRIVKNINPTFLQGNPTGEQIHNAMRCPYGVVGDRLWIREAFTYWEYEEPKKNTKTVRWEDLTPKQQANAIEQASHVGEDYLVYKGGGAKRSLGEWKFPHPIYEHCIGRFGKTIPAIHMPRWACRTVVEIMEIRVQRVQEITTEDARAEGILVTHCPDWHAVTDFKALWASINGADSWDANPWVWAITFNRLDTPAQKETQS